MSEEVVIGRRHVLVVPKAIREQLGLKEGQTVLMRLEDKRIVIEPLPSDPYEVLAEVIREPYTEAKDEPRAEDWLRRHAGR